MTRPPIRKIMSATKVVTTATLTDAPLAARAKSRTPAQGEKALQEIDGRPGLVLLSGEAGTSKAQARAIAERLGRTLQSVDLAAIVSRYIGETEKALDRLFAAAQKAGVVLFFDEADALFGKRTEVRDAHDRYANIETAQLLARLERYDGLVILASNREAVLDEALVRRLRFSVTFPGPDDR